MSAVTRMGGALFWCNDRGTFGKGASRPLGQVLDPSSFSLIYLSPVPCILSAAPEVVSG